MRAPGRDPAPDWQSLSLLLVEDDRGDAVLVEDLITDAVADIEVVWAQSMAHAERALASARPDCVLLDLNLPDASGIDALDRIAKRDATVPIVVLTGLNDEYFGASAVAAGAQDYLVKGRVEPEMLRRALLYAIERKRAELISADLHASQLRARENALLERGLLPSPLLLDNPGVDIVTRYRPSRESALLCGDFYDVVQTPDRVTHVLIGDVAGHGPDEAALGAALRIAWRTLTFAGIDGADRMPQLERVLHAERTGDGVFATVLSLQIPPDGARITAVRAGHPGMLLHGAGTVEWIEPPWSRSGPACRRLAAARDRIACGQGYFYLPTDSSRGIRVEAANVSARTVCLRWPVRSRDCPVRRSSTRSLMGPRNALRRTAGLPMT